MSKRQMTGVSVWTCGSGMIHVDMLDVHAEVLFGGALTPADARSLAVMLTKAAEVVDGGEARTSEWTALMGQHDTIHDRVMQRREALRRELSDIDLFLAVYERVAGVVETSHECGVEQQAARQAHNLEVAGSNPAPATKHGAHHEPDRAVQGEGAIGALPDNPAASAPDCLPLVGGGRPAPTDPRPAPEPANEGGADDVNATTAHPREGPASQNAASAPVRGGLHPRMAAKREKFLGLSAQERSDRVLAVLHAEAEAGGRVPLTYSKIAERSGVPGGSLGGTFKSLEANGLIRRLDGELYLVRQKPSAPAAAKGGQDATQDTQQERSGTAREAPGPGSGTTVEAAASPDVGVQPAAPSAEAPRPLVPSRIGDEGPPPKVAFESSVPKPAWDFGRDGATIVKAPERPGCPSGLAVSGSYLLLGKHHIRLPEHAAAIVGRLVNDWGVPVAKAALAEEIMSRSVTGMTNAKAARTHTELKALAEINALIKPAGLMVLEDSGAWHLMLRQEAGSRA